MPTNPTWENTVEETTPAWDDTTDAPPGGGATRGFKTPAQAEKLQRQFLPTAISEDQLAGMSQRAARDEQNRIAGNAMHDPGTGLTTALYHDLPADIGQGLYTVGDVIYEGGVAAMQHGIEDLAGLPPDTAEQPGLTTTEAIRTYPPAVQAGIRGAEGFVRTLPQMGIAAVNPYAGAISFGFTPEGFSAKNAAIAAALPFIGSKAGAVVENIAARAGVSGDVALQAFQKIGGAAGAAGLIGADEAYHISQLPEEEQRQAWIDATGNIGSMFLLGTMGHSERLKNTDKVLADRASANAETMRGIERDFNRRNARPSDEGADVPTWEGTEAKPIAESRQPAAVRTEPRPSEMEYAGGEMPVGGDLRFAIDDLRLNKTSGQPDASAKSPQTITGSNVQTGTEMPVQPKPAQGEQSRVSDAAYQRAAAATRSIAGKPDQAVVNTPISKRGITDKEITQAKRDELAVRARNVATRRAAAKPAETPVKNPLPQGQSEISKDQAVAIHGGRKGLLPKPGETKPQLQDASGEYFVGQTADGRFFTEHKPKSKPAETAAAPLSPEVLTRQIDNLEYRMKQDKARGMTRPENVARLAELKSQLAAMPAKGGDVTIQQQSTVPKADVTTPPQSAPAVKRVASGLRARKVFDRETELGGPDILSFIQEFGGMQSKTEANRSRGKEWWAQNKSLYDDASPLQRPQHNVIYGGKSYPDQIAQAAYDAKVLRSPDVNELWIAIRNASNRRAKVFENVRTEEKLLKAQEEWSKATAEGELRIAPEDLQPGDTFEVDGERFKVQRFDKNTGEVIIQDGPKFGQQRIAPGQSIWVENAGDSIVERIAENDGNDAQPIAASVPKLRAGEKGTGDLLQGEDAPFNLAGERGTDSERIAAAKSQAEANARAAAEFAAKNQQDMFGARGTSAVGDPMMPPIPPGVPSGVHSSGRMPVAMERIVPGQVDIPTIMDAMENVVRAVGAESPIRTGRFYAQARGIFKTFDKVIRLRAADNIPTAAHEVAHAVSDAVFGSSGSAALMRAMKPSPLYKQAVAELRALGRALYGNTKPAAGYTAEGFSELTRLWLTTENAVKSAPNATKWLETELFKAQPQLHAAMKNARDLVDVWRGQGAEGRAAAQSKGPDTRFEQLKKIAKEYLGKQAQVEEFAPLEELSRGFERISGKRLAPSQDPFMLATANRGVAGHILENFVERGVQDIWGNRTGPSLKEAFARLKPEDAENFRNYLWSRRALERWGKNKNPGLTLEDATYLKNKLETPAFIDAASKWYQWWDGVLEYVKAASPATNGPLVDAIRAGSKDYVPLARVLPESAQRAAQSRMGAGMMKMHGSGLPVREIYLQSLLTAERLISRAHKDMVMDSVFKLSQTEGMGWLVERVPRTKVMEGLNIEKIREQLEGMGVDTTAIPADTLLKYASHMDRPTGSDPIMVRIVNGNPEWYQVPAGLFDLLQGVDAPRLGKVADLFLGVPNRMFKMGTTGLRASFSLVTNPLRDLPTFMHQSLAGNPASRMAEYVSGLHDIVKAGLTGKESAEWQTFKQLGIGGGNFLGGDIRQAQREAKSLFHGKVFRRLASPVETLREALSFTESAPRLAEMNLVGKESGWKPGAKLTPDQAIAMKVAAKRVTTDFSSGGRVSKMVNQAVPFYNAVIQGTRSFGRAFQKEQGFKTKDHAAAKATLTGLALLTLPTIYNWWRNKDEEWYRNLPWRERYLYTNVDAGDGTIVQVPRPAEWGNVFQVVPEILLDSWYQRDPIYLKEGLKHIFATQNPLDYPVLLKLAKEQWSNRIDFFDKPIVPRGELDLPPGQQRAYFSSILAKSLGDAFPNTVSPRRVDAAVRGIFGGVGSDLADAPGAMMRMMGIKDSGVRESEPADIPVMGRLFRRGGEFSANGKYLADFWDSYMQHQALLKGNTHSLKAGGQPTATSKELVSARILTAYHAAIKLQMEMAARATEQEDRRRLYKQATETARRALEATK